jgi:hypothetical protein
MPAFLGAGARPVDRWLDRGARSLRLGLLTGAIVLSGAIGALVALPLLPERDAGPVIALNPDVGETIGWPAFARTIARAYPEDPRAVILTYNYGEAGAVDRYDTALGLPHAYSGHNAYGDWGPPPNGSAPVVAVGLPLADLARLRGCHVVARIDNGLGIDNDEQGTHVDVCRGPVRPWSQEWPALRHLG